MRREARNGLIEAQGRRHRTSQPHSFANCTAHLTMSRTDFSLLRNGECNEESEPSGRAMCTELEEHELDGNSLPRERL